MWPKKDKVIVELCGLPGVGKTTFAKRLVVESGYRLVVANLKKYHYVTLSFVYPVTVFFWLTLIFKSFLKVGSWKIFTFNVSLLYSSLQKMHDARKSTEKFVVVDEGLVQRFLSYSDVIHDSKTIKKLLRFSPLGSVIVFVDDRAVEKDRYGDSHLRASKGEEYLKNWKINLQNNLQAVQASVAEATTLTSYSTKDNFDVILHSSK